MAETLHSSVRFTEDKLAQISDNERLILEKFFQLLIKSDGLGYVLFGSKPVCLSGYFSCVPIGNMLGGCHASYAIKAGWNVWKKYEKYFSHPKYLIFEEVKNVEEIEIHSIYFIHKEKLLEALEKHQPLFERELTSHFDPKKFLHRIEDKQVLLGALNNHEGLLGILLGYGVSSSMNYHKRELVWKCGLPISYEESDFQAISADYFDDAFIQTDIQPIHFAGNPQSPEVKAILEQNAKEQTSLVKIYSQGKFLEITLKKLTEQ
jgi:hypothetical protein